MGRRRHRVKNPSQIEGQKDTRKPYEDIVKENPKFIKYYKAQQVCKEEEWEEFICSLKTDLPATFRITGSKDEAKKMLTIVQNQLINECLNQNDEKLSASIMPLPWYPDKLAWQLELSRKDIRRHEAYFKLHNFLITETENGTISRQETVSMIPPLLLDVKPHHKVLDMCAAPGSKTAQLIEMLHAGGDNVLPEGYVVANDVDNKRCYMLVHQAKRLNSPCMAVVNHDSTIMPNLYESSSNGDIKQVQFDRILCDVPCSGDGTLRKNPDIWLKWTPANCLFQHVVQTRILKRGAELVAVGGRLVYSTCSLNPLENEAVIHRVLVDTKGALELVDAAKELPELKHTAGLETWLVGNKHLEYYNSFEEVPQKWRTVIRPQMYPPKPEDREKFHLNRCIRILPHHQNTGAFFVAVLKKVKPITVKEILVTSEANVNEDDKCEESVTKGANKREIHDTNTSHRNKKRRFNGYKEDPFVFFNKEEALWPEIKSFYQISDEFDPVCLLTRCHGGKKKNIYYTSPAVRDLVLQNQNAVKFINTGVRTFVRSDNRNMKCAFRLAQEGLESIFQCIGDDRKIEIPRDDLITLLMNTDPQKPPMIDRLSEGIQKQMENLSPGSCILIHKEENNSDSLVLHVSGWRGTHSLRAYTSLPSTVHLLRLLGGDITKYTINKFKKEDVATQSTAELKEVEGE